MKEYISLPDNMTFQKRPTGATLFKVMPDGSTWKEKFSKAVNMDGARLLELCDGQSDLPGLTARFNELYPDNALTVEKAAAFFKRSAEERIVLFGAEKKRSKVRFAGSYEHFYPQHSTIELTDQCNYKCAHCYRGSSPQASKHIDFEKCKQYINDLWENGGTVLELTGGEPLLHKNFFEIVDYAYARMGMIGVLTNGYYLQEEAVERLVKYKDKVMFNISLDSCRPEFHDKFRGKEGAFAKTTHAMELLGKYGFTYRAAMSVTEDNFFDIEGTIKLAKKYGARIFGMSPVMDMGRGEELCGVKQAEPSKDYIQKCSDYEKHIMTDYRDYLHLITEEQSKAVRDSNCGLLHRSVVVGPDGELRPCVMFGGDIITIGNIYKQSFKEIFEGGLGPVFSKLNGPKAAICGDCKHFQYCQNCSLKGVKMALKTPDCRWAKETGILKYVKSAPAPKTCGNAQEPYYG